jgi:hypothetical protein
MPIPKQLRHLYRGKAYEAFVSQLLDRAGNACEQCKAPNRQRVFRVQLKEFAGWWWSELSGMAHDPFGNSWPDFGWVSFIQAYPNAKSKPVKIILGPAHLNRTPGDLDPSHSKALCQRCHIVFDVEQHTFNSMVTRCNRKDGERPLLEATA